MPFGQHRGQRELRRGPPRWRRRDVAQHVTGNPVSHQVADMRIELRCTGEELARDFGLLSAQPGQLQ
jgi:hypothetical protein